MEKSIAAYNVTGTKLGGYEIETLLCRSGSGIVFRARQKSVDRPVALKVLSADFSSDPASVGWFQKGAGAIARLDHPNIIRVYEITEENSIYFFSMEYAEGRTLGEVLKENGRVCADERMRIIASAARAIEHAHRYGIVHGNIRPSCIFIEASGNVKVMGFGHAWTSKRFSRQPQSNSFLKTIGYTPPERYRLEELDERSDIYSLGVVLYEVLTGRLPFDAPNEMALVYKITHEDPLEVRYVNPDVPDGLSRVVSRAMSRNREQRYSSISGFLNDVSRFEPTY